MAAMGLKAVMWNVIVVVLIGLWVGSAEASVSYDSKAIVINGQRRILVSGSIHYPRSTPEVLLQMCLLGLFGFLFFLSLLLFFNWVPLKFPAL
jgi:hypothetical protein